MTTFHILCFSAGFILVDGTFTPYFTEVYFCDVRGCLRPKDLRSENARVLDIIPPVAKSISRDYEMAYCQFFPMPVLKQVICTLAAHIAQGNLYYQVNISEVPSLNAEFCI